MVPSATWFPSSLSARADWFNNFQKQFVEVAAALGLADEIPQVNADNAVMQFSASSFIQVEAYGKAMTQFRRIVTEGLIGENEPAIPTSPVLTAPAAVPTGIFQRLAELRERILAAKNYTAEIGALLGILPQTPAHIAPGEAKPAIQIFSSQTGYTFSIVVVNRGESDMWDVYLLRKGAAGWTKEGTYTGKAADITVQPTTPGDAEQMQARVQLRRKNQNYGQPSDVVYVTINP